MLNTHDIQLRDEEQGHEEGLAAQPPFGWKKVSVLWGFLLVNICFALRAPDRLAWRVWLRLISHLQPPSICTAHNQHWAEIAKLCALHSCQPSNPCELSRTVMSLDKRLVLYWTGR